MGYPPGMIEYRIHHRWVYNRSTRSRKKSSTDTPPHEYDRMDNMYFFYECSIHCHHSNWHAHMDDHRAHRRSMWTDRTPESGAVRKARTGLLTRSEHRTDCLTHHGISHRPIRRAVSHTLDGECHRSCSLRIVVRYECGSSVSPHLFPRRNHRTLPYILCILITSIPWSFTELCSWYIWRCSVNIVWIPSHLLGKEKKYATISRLYFIIFFYEKNHSWYDRIGHQSFLFGAYIIRAWWTRTTWR